MSKKIDMKTHQLLNINGPNLTLRFYLNRQFVQCDQMCNTLSYNVKIPSCVDN